MFRREFLHIGDKMFDAFDGHRVVNGRAHTADKTVSFDCHDSVCFRACDELRVEFLRGGYERHVHHASVFGTDGVGIESAVVDVIVQHFCFFFVDFLDCRNAAEVFKLAM